MKLKTRRYIFYSLTFLFFIVASIVLLYSQGYRFNFETGTIDTIGGIYIRSEPSDANITIDDEYVENKSGFIKSGTLISGLTPGTHKIVLNKDNYSSWEKNADVKSGIVSVFENIILVPNEEREMIYTSVDEFFIENNRILIKNGGVITFGELEILGDDVISFDGAGDVLTSGDNGEIYYLSNVFDETPPTNINNLFNNLKDTQLNLSGAVPIRKISPYPFNGKRFVIMTGRALYTLDTERLEIEQISPEVNDFVISDNNLFWNNDDGLFSYHLVFRTNSDIDLGEDFNLSNIKQIGVDTNEDFVGIIDANNRFSLFDVGLATTTDVLRDVTFFSFSDDGGVLALVKNNNNLSVFYLTDQEVHEELFVDIYTLPNIVKTAMWHRDNSHMFILDTSDTLHFVEIDDSKPINAPLISTGVKGFEYDSDKDLLYYDNGLGIFRLEI